MHHVEDGVAWLVYDEDDSDVERRQHTQILHERERRGRVQP